MVLLFGSVLTFNRQRAMAVAASLAIVASPGAFSPQAHSDPAPGSDVGVFHWSCGRAAPPDIDTTGGHTVSTVRNMYAGSSTRCALSGGQAYRNDSLDYHCWARDINGRDTWTYVVSVPSPSARGWIRDAYLSDGGSLQKCPGQTPPSD